MLKMEERISERIDRCNHRIVFDQCVDKYMLLKELSIGLTNFLVHVLFPKKE